jgi:hypothetical protein
MLADRLKKTLWICLRASALWLREGATRLGRNLPLVSQSGYRALPILAVIVPEPLSSFKLEVPCVRIHKFSMVALELAILESIEQK